MSSRRRFIHQLGASSVFVLNSPSSAKPKYPEVDDHINHLGPKKGYTPLVGSMISMLDWVSNSVIQYNLKLSIDQLDYVHDAESNSIGSLMMHVAATEVIYQDITFNNLEDFTPENKSRWGVAMDLGEEARKTIKGHTLSYYKEAIDEVRTKTKSEMKKRDDLWFTSGATKEWDWNNYCKWFHVAEHYANHRGQMTWYAKRIK